MSTDISQDVARLIISLATDSQIGVKYIGDKEFLKYLINYMQSEAFYKALVDFGYYSEILDNNPLIKPGKAPLMFI